MVAQKRCVVAPIKSGVRSLLIEPPDRFKLA